MGNDGSVKQRSASGQARNPSRDRPGVTGASPATPGRQERRRTPKRETGRPHRYLVTILGDLPLDLADRVAGLHAAAIQGRDDASEPSDGLVEPDDRPSGAVRRTPAPHG